MIISYNKDGHSVGIKLRLGQIILCYITTFFQLFYLYIVDEGVFLLLFFFIKLKVAVFFIQIDPQVMMEARETIDWSGVAPI